MEAPNMFHRLAAELIGTFWLVLGSAVFAAKFLSGGFSVGIGFLGVAIAFGLTVLTGVYAFGTISGGHSTPRSHWALRSHGASNGKLCPATGSSR
jgi:aquaporin Z